MDNTLAPADPPVAGSAAGLRPSGLLFSRVTLVAALVGLAVSVWLERPAMVALLAVGLSAAGLALIWARFCLAAVTCERRFSGGRLFPGEAVEVVLRVENRKPLPLPWVEVADEAARQTEQRIWAYTAEAVAAASRAQRPSEASTSIRVKPEGLEMGSGIVIDPPQEVLHGGHGLANGKRGFRVSAFPRRCGCGAAFVRVWRVGVDLIHPWDKPMGVSCLLLRVFSRAGGWAGCRVAVACIGRRNQARRSGGGDCARPAGR